MAKNSGNTRGSQPQGSTGSFHQENLRNLGEISTKWGTDRVESATLANSIVKDMDIVGYHDDIEDVMKQFGLRLTSTDASAPSTNGVVALKMNARNSNGDRITLDRRFSRDADGNLVVDHHLFVISKDLQGKGFSKAIMRALYKHYKEAGVKKITVFANIDVGGYTWGRYGFTARNQRHVQYVLADAKRMGVKQSIITRATKLVNDYYKYHDPNSPFPMNLLADRSYGKELLKGTDWSGQIDLTDDTQRKVFERYMNSKSKSKK